MNAQIEVIKVEEENLSPQKYLDLSKIELSNIIRTTIVPPRLGKSDFGHIHVVYRTPTYRIAK